MTALPFLIGVVVGLLLGALLATLWVRGSFAARTAASESERDVLRARVADLQSVRDADADTASLLAPLSHTIERVEAHVGALERDRVRQFGELGERLSAVGRSTESLRTETASLASALNSSTVRGAWGEVQLRRVLELSGLLARCDFDEQVTSVSAHGTTVRPDAVINLPGGRHVVVDAKSPMSHFLQAHAETVSDLERAQLLAAHATALRRHVEGLAAKAYWSAFTRSPEVVICFVPGEAILATALSDDPGLYEHALSRKVVLASPGTLYAVLRTVGAVWQQDALDHSARELLILGRDLYSRLTTLGGHVASMGASLGRSVEQYNRFVGTLESRVLVTARRMNDLHLATETSVRLEPVEASPRSLSATELTDDFGSDARDDAYLQGEGSPGHGSTGRPDRATG